MLLTSTRTGVTEVRYMGSTTKKNT